MDQFGLSNLLHGVPWSLLYFIRLRWGRCGGLYAYDISIPMILLTILNEFYNLTLPVQNTRQGHGFVYVDGLPVEIM